MEDCYPKAYKETYEILKYLPKEDQEKIPREMINMLKINMDKEYEYSLDKSKPFEEQKMLKETREILAIFYKDYWATPERQKIIQEKIENDIKKAEELKKEKYNPNNIFQNRREIKRKEDDDRIPQSLIESNNKWYIKIFDFIKNVFKR